MSGATDAARAAADLVLTAPGLSVITRAIEEARRIFERMTAYATYRIAETIRVLLFMTLSIVIFNFYPVTAVMIVLLGDPQRRADHDDRLRQRDGGRKTGTLGHGARADRQRHVRHARRDRIASCCSGVADRYLHLPRETLQTLIFLKLLVAGHLTIYLTRNSGWFWQRPLPHWRLFLATETTQVLGTLAAVYGWFVAPIGWKYALMIWAYALAWFVFNNVAKVLIYRMLRGGPRFMLRRRLSANVREQR